ncbi:RsmD family RNA methyltransferase [Robertkochia aurantiaca]|uniref:RsmD family RNA methyltransferase n=1 Tax=Robertkochia aurantiaca TaxID=2873700 RepID=UPI001CCA6F3F|nr:RsmD family RNA methyltransferase [Robertkochia sp. 3YJGBD-33]
MRIISGKYKGKRLIAPAKLPVRPTTDFAKEALFNVLNNHYHLDGLRVIDLFAGIGSISFEFASRGCESILAVDKHPGCLAFIRKTADQLDLPVDTVKSDVFSFLERYDGKADIIFADPPYDFPEKDFARIAEIVFEKDQLEEDGMLIIEHSKHTNLESYPYFDNARKYGGSVFSFFEKP